LLAIGLGILTVFFALLAPSLYLLLYGVFAADRDGYAFLQLFSIFSINFKFLTRAGFLLSYVVISLIFIKRYHRFPRTIRWMINTIQLLSLYILIVSLAKGENIERSLSFLVYSGLPAYVIWVVSSFGRRTIIWLYMFIFLQITIAGAVLLVPELSFINGGNYKQIEGISVVEMDGVNLGTSFDKNQIGGFGQFHNPNALGFYAAISIALGLVTYRLLEIGTLSKLLGIYLVLMGTFCWLNSLTRGPLLMLLIGIVFCSIFIPKIDSRISKKRINWRGFILIFGLIILASATGVMSYLTPDSSNISVAGRVDGYIAGLDAATLNPLLGISSSWVWPDLAYPHLLPLSFAAEYGILGGFLIFVIIFIGGFLTMRKAVMNSKATPNKNQIYYLVIYLIMIIWGAALTNNLIAPILFWIAFGEAMLLAYGFDNKKYKKFDK